MQNPDDIKKYGNLIKVGVVDDHHLFRAGLISLLEHFKEVKVTLEASNGRNLIDQLTQLKKRNKPGKANYLPDVILLDLQMPEMNGIQSTLFLQEEFPAIKIIILTMHNEEEFIFDLMNKGASGFLAKDKTVENVMDAISSVVKDGVYINEEILKAIVRGSQIKTAGTRFSEPYKELTKREKDILQLICEQKTTREIAEVLQLSHRTVELQRITILSKTGVKNTAGLVLYALKHNLVTVK